jgi:hypothetical protein
MFRDLPTEESFLRTSPALPELKEVIRLAIGTRKEQEELSEVLTKSTA